MNINGKTSIFAVLGYPIRHTFSPQIHNAVFQKLKKNAFYVPLEVYPDVLYLAVEGLKSLNIAGASVTVPLKEKIVQLLDEVPGDLDRAIGAVNTVHLKDGRLYGYNTDGPALIADLKQQLGFSPKGKDILLVGAGGAARAAAFYMAHEGCDALYIMNRTEQRAKGLVEYLNAFFPGKNIEMIDTVEHMDDERVHLIINATSCGMKEDDPYPLDPDFLSRTDLVYDLIYNPMKTKLIREAEKRSLKASNGLGMLMYQAALAEKIWFPDLNVQESLKIMEGAL